MNELTMQNDCIITETERENLVEDIKELLDEYDYDYSTFAIESIVDEWADQKEELILAFKKHPNYIDGKFMIAFNYDYERTFDKAAVKKFGEWLVDIVPSRYEDIPDCIKERRNGCLFLPNDLWNFLEDLGEYITDRTISKELTMELEDIIPEIRPHAGEKTSRVINKICTYLGLNKHPDYNREYAKFADALNPLVIKCHTVLSLNPLDYLTMSFGNSWASCHTIDKNNKRGMPDNYSGCYSSGTISYMLDGSSMVLYTVDSKYDGDDYWTQSKINRQMFHWGEEKLVQSRLYPQSNDDGRDAYAPYRNIVQQIISTVFDFPNLWTLSRGTDAASRYIISRGTHYRDYNNFSSCTLSRMSGSTNENEFVVGHDPICVDCGEEHDNAENINCCAERYTCHCCGCVIHSEDDVVWVGDYAYCSDCTTYCERCDSYELNDDCFWVESENRYVCRYCRDNYYRECDDCGELFDIDDVYWIESTESYVCQDCLDENYTQCEICEDYFPNDELRYDEDREIYLCDKCYEEEDEEVC